MLLERLKANLNRTCQRLERLDQIIPGRPEDRLAAYRDDPTLIMRDAGFIPDPWQANLLQSNDPRILICAARQVGKSRAVSFLALQTILTKPRSTVIIVAPVAEQSNELLGKVIESYHAIDDPIPVKREAVTRLELMNGSRVIALPGLERRMRSYTASLLLIDEAARVPDAVMNAASPTMAVSRGRMIALSTAFAKSGWFYKEWVEGDCKQLSITAQDCPRIPADFLRSERRKLGKRWFEMEYLNVFGDDMAAVFSTEDIKAAVSYEVKPLFPVRKDYHDDSGKSPATDPAIRPLFGR
ncbi:MAG TPA: terminase family protein [Gemmata sp.]|jgi:phage terminase large subunit|nr:terminase family protein [Gemmata sp.]